jgi:hypothetical protein
VIFTDAKQVFGAELGNFELDFFPVLTSDIERKVRELKGVTVFHGDSLSVDYS